MVYKEKQYLFIILTLFMVVDVSAHPVSAAHAHDQSTIKWELVPNSNGESAHNHFLNRWFGVGQLDNEVPFDVHACWDNQSHRFYSQGFLQPLDFAHCYINKNSPLAGQVPTYRFDGVNWPADAKQRVRDAFSEWSSVATPAVTVGAQFVEIPSGSAQVTVRWVSQLPGIPPPGTTGKWEPDIRVLNFKNIPTWNFSQSSSGLQTNEHHFYSVAIHEVGHAFGFDHTGTTDSVMYIDPGHDIGAPPSEEGRYFSSIDSVDEFAIKNVYGIPALPPPQPCELTYYPIGCNGSIAMGTITATLPGYSVTNADYDVTINGGPWIDIFEGLLTCPGLDLEDGFSAAALAILQTAYGVSQCIAFIPEVDCDGPPGGPFGF